MIINQLFVVNTLKGRERREGARERQRKHEKHEKGRDRQILKERDSDERERF